MRDLRVKEGPDLQGESTCLPIDRGTLEEKPVLCAFDRESKLDVDVDRGLSVGVERCNGESECLEAVRGVTGKSDAACVP